MTTNGIIQILLYLVVLTVLPRPFGISMTKVYAAERTPLSFLFGTFERLFYKIGRVNPNDEMTWRQYGIAMLLFSLVSGIAVYAIQRLQYFLPLNPQELAAPSEHSSFNTAVSFMTNTDWQGYG